MHVKAHFKFFSEGGIAPLQAAPGRSKPENGAGKEE